MNYLGETTSIDWINTAGQVATLSINTYYKVKALQQQLDATSNAKEKAELRLQIARLTANQTAAQIEEQKLEEDKRAKLTKNIAIYGGAAAVLTAILLQ